MGSVEGSTAGEWMPGSPVSPGSAGVCACEFSTVGVWPSRPGTDQIDAKLAALRVPTLLIRGSRDRIAPQSWLDHAAGLIPGARTLTVHGAAHNVATTAGPQTAAAVTTFIDSAAEPTAE